MKPSKQQPDSGLKVLFADDEEHLQSLMSMELPHMGHRVTVCPDGESAVREARESAFDCLIVDLDMPGLNGIELARKAGPEFPDMKILYMSGYTDENLDSGNAFSREQFIQKPFLPSSLTDRVRELLEPDPARSA